MKQIIHLNASALKYASCIRKLEWTIISGYKTGDVLNDIEFGTAFHEFIKVMRLNPQRFDLATAAALKKWKDAQDAGMRVKYNKTYMNENYLIKTCLDYWNQVAEKDLFQTVIGSDGLPICEMQFAIPYYSDDKYEVLLCGTIDDICKHQTGTYAIRDYKTTASFDHKEYLEAYALSHQLMFYRFVVKLYAQWYPESIWAEMHHRGIACFIDGIFVRGRDKAVEFHRSAMFQYTEQQLAEFEQGLNAIIKRIVDRFSNPVNFPPREGMINSSCSGIYGKCHFFNVCSQPDEVASQHILNRYFKQETYNPLNRE
jgi:hypothetical protein